MMTHDDKPKSANTPVIRRVQAAASVLALTLALVGCGSTRIVTQTQTVTKTHTQTQTVTVANKVASAPTLTVTVTAPTSPAKAPALSGAKTFSGNGSEMLGTISAARNSRIYWTNDGPDFAVADPTLAFDINSQGHSGTSALAAGTYPNVSLQAIGNWTIKIILHS